VAADSSNRLPEWIPADRTNEVREARIVDVVLEFSEKVLWSLKPADTQCWQFAGHTKFSAARLSL
jgi:hypothetical protein